MKKLLSDIHKVFVQRAIEYAKTNEDVESSRKQRLPEPYGTVVRVGYKRYWVAELGKIVTTDLIDISSDKPCDEHGDVDGNSINYPGDMPAFTDYINSCKDNNNKKLSDNSLDPFGDSYFTRPLWKTETREYSATNNKKKANLEELKDKLDKKWHNTSEKGNTTNQKGYYVFTTNFGKELLVDTFEEGCKQLFDRSKFTPDELKKIWLKHVRANHANLSTSTYVLDGVYCRFIPE